MVGKAWNRLSYLRGFDAWSDTVGHEVVSHDDDCITEHTNTEASLTSHTDESIHRIVLTHCSLE